jgi:hypothetical protein
MNQPLHSTPTGYPAAAQRTMQRTMQRTNHRTNHRTTHRTNQHDTGDARRALLRLVLAAMLTGAALAAATGLAG